MVVTCERLVGEWGIARGRDTHLALRGDCPGDQREGPTNANIERRTTAGRSIPRLHNPRTLYHVLVDRMYH